ncbi:MAG: serine hydrolase domain-containing protein [Betaproteobacteria bacterium]|jgi:CubicO group peptidase (beta-lactamase class C family)
MGEQPAARSLDFLDPRLKALCAAYLQEAQTPGASISIVAGDRAYHLAYGVKSLRTGEPMTAATAINIGSCSKAFVSAAMASLVADRLASWDDPASKWVPEFQLYDAALTRQVTLRDLSGNRLGIPRAGLVEFGFDPSQSAAAALEGLRHTAPVCGLRERHTYVNGGHTAVALAVGRITGKGFLPTLRERILDPLGMHATSGGVAARDELPDQSGWHCLVDGSTQAIDTVYSDWYLGGGGMSVSGADALQWLRLHLNGGLVDGQQILPREALLETHTPQIVAWPRKDIISLFHPGAHMAAYGLGWAVTELEGHPLVIHSGGDFGIAAMTLLFPRDGIGIACYCNSSGRGTVPLPYALAACLLGLKPRDWKAYFEAAMPANAPAPAVGESGRSTDPDLHAGRYSHPADGELVIERDGDGLRGNFLRGYRMAFTASPAGDRRFVIQFESPEWRSLTAVEKPLLVFDAGDGPSATVDWVVGSLSRRLTRDA